MSARRFMGQCRVKGCRFVVSIPVDGDRTVVACSDENHRRPFMFPWQGIAWREVRGTFKANQACDARCTGAHGSECECSCAGENHGTDHLMRTICDV